MKTTQVVATYVAAGFCFALAGYRFTAEQGPTQWDFWVVCVGAGLVAVHLFRRGKIPGAAFEMAQAESQPAPAESPSPSSSPSSSAAAQQYPYLPQSYGRTHTATDAEWQCLRLVATRNTELYLTENLVQTGLTARLRPTRLAIGVDTRPQSTWDAHTGRGQFTCPDRELRAAYDDAAAYVMDVVRQYFPEISDQDVRIYFSVLGHHVGIWQGGNMALKGEEEPAADPEPSC